jgi:hypothetical protein
MKSKLSRVCAQDIFGYLLLVAYFMDPLLEFPDWTLDPELKWDIHDGWKASVKLDVVLAYACYFILKCKQFQTASFRSCYPFCHSICQKVSQVLILLIVWRVSSDCILLLGYFALFRYESPVKVVPSNFFLLNSCHRKGTSTYSGTEI